jgi:hypothetical protein
MRPGDGGSRRRHRTPRAVGYQGLGLGWRRLDRPSSSLISTPAEVGHLAGGLISRGIRRGGVGAMGYGDGGSPRRHRTPRAVGYQGLGTKPAEPDDFVGENRAPEEEEVGRRAGDPTGSEIRRGLWE